MLLSPGTRLGPYEIHSQLGEGGMGVVYRAKDTRLNRIVAIKVLASPSANPELRQRFEREAQTIATLNHPYICAIYDVGEQDGTAYIVMEYLEGGTLAARIGRGPLPLDQALTCAIQIADALDKAHSNGVVHRDVKPANIMLTRSGIKLLDFGLAKLKPVESAAGVSSLPTAAGVTAQGTILGTLQYMAPEQLEGRDADARTDIFAFGEVVYEMVTGRRVFEAKSQASLIAAILEHHPPPMSSMQKLTPPALEELVQGCLAKDSEDRWQSARDVLRHLKVIGSSAGAESGVRKGRSRAREHVAWSLVALSLAIAVMSALYFRRPASELPEMRLQILTPPADDPFAFAISPDGGKVVFQANMSGKSHLWLRSLDSETAQPLAGTEGATSANPFWSPDSQSIGFIGADGQLRRIDTRSGRVQTIVPSNPFGAKWNTDGTILFARTSTGPLRRISADGGTAVEVTRVDSPRVTGHWEPYFLPDGRHFIFWGWGLPEYKGVYIGSLDSTETRRLFDADARAVFVPPDHILFVRQKALMAQRLDLKTLLPVGEALTIAAQVHTVPFALAVSASATGSVAYRSRGPERQLTWLDRSGRDVVSVGQPDADIVPPVFARMRVAPGGRTVALTRNPILWRDVWMMDTSSDVPQAFTSDVGNKFDPIWSPKGDRIVFSWDPKGVLDLYEKSISDAGNGKLLWSNNEHKHSLDWSSDGRFILYNNFSEQTGLDLWALPYSSTSGDKKPLEVSHGNFDEDAGRFSPNGRWIAFQSNETGRPEIVVQPFPGSGIGKKQITRDGGVWPQWRGDGRELFYLAPDNRLMAIPISTSGSEIEAGNPVPLFTLPPQSDFAAGRDGQRFLVNKIVRDAAPITILLNWKPR